MEEAVRERLGVMRSMGRLLQSSRAGGLLPWARQWARRRGLCGQALRDRARVTAELKILQGQGFIPTGFSCLHSPLPRLTTITVSDRQWVKFGQGQAEPHPGSYPGRCWHRAEMPLRLRHRGLKQHMLGIQAVLQGRISGTWNSMSSWGQDRLHFDFVNHRDGSGTFSTPPHRGSGGLPIRVKQFQCLG